MELSVLAKRLEQVIASVPDYPKPGILFRDVTSLLQDGPAFAQVIQHLVEHYQGQGFTKIVGTESRGFIFGAPLAVALGIGFVPVRKPGKLPRPTIAESYQLEYGQDTLEIHTDAISSDDKVLLVDDLLATGGTIDATTSLVRRLGGQVADATFIVNLPDLGGAERLARLGLNVYALVDFPGH